MKDTFKLDGKEWKFEEVDSISFRSQQFAARMNWHRLTSEYPFAQFLKEYAEWLEESSKPKLADGWYHALNHGNLRYILYVKDNRYFAPWCTSNLFGWGGGDLSGVAYTDFQPLNWGPFNSPEYAAKVVRSLDRWESEDWIYNG